MGRIVLGVKKDILACSWMKMVLKLLFFVHVKRLLENYDAPRLKMIFFLE